MSQRKPFEKQEDTFKPSTKDILFSTGAFLTETGKELKKAETDIEHTCPRRKKLAKAKPSSVVVAANNAGKDIPLNKDSAEGFIVQAKLEKKPMTREDLVKHVAREIQIRDGFNKEGDRLVREAEELAKKGVLTPEDAQKYKTRAAYNYSGRLIHTALFSVKAVAIPGSTAEKMYKLDKEAEKFNTEEVQPETPTRRSSGPRSGGGGGCLIS